MPSSSAQAAQGERSTLQLDGRPVVDAEELKIWPASFPGEAKGTRTPDPLLANYWRYGQCESLSQVTGLMTVVQRQLRALRLLYFRAVRGDSPAVIS
jgi:hypothetical protein